MPFPQAPADGGDKAGFGVVGGHVGDVHDLWPNEVVQRVQVGGGGGAVREGYKVVALLSLFWTYGPAATPRVCHQPPDFFLHTMKWLQVLLLKNNYSIKHHLFAHS